MANLCSAPPPALFPPFSFTNGSIHGTPYLGATNVMLSYQKTATLGVAFMCFVCNDPIIPQCPQGWPLFSGLLVYPVIKLQIFDITDTMQHVIKRGESV